MSRINLVPLAGAGSRFAKAGYKDPKPLIPVDNIPMIIRATQDMPKADSWIFLCRTEHLEDYPLRATLEQYYPGCTIIEVAELTEGQASTCLLAREYITNDDELFIAACDNGMAYEKDEFEDLRSNDSVNGILFSFRNNVTVENNPSAYGWIKTDDNNTITGMSVKKAISDDPINDHAVVGAFWFRHGKDFVTAADDMIAKNIRINNEFYVDECINNFVEAGNMAKVFEIDHYVCWGTPNDLDVYKYWKRYFTQ